MLSEQWCSDNFIVMLLNITVQQHYNKESLNSDGQQHLLNGQQHYNKESLNSDGQQHYNV